jgi:hypothetical protein
MWNIDTKLLCDKHLLGEHLEMHMFVGSINKGISMKGYLEKGLLKVSLIPRRHEELALELERRGMNHLSPLPRIKGYPLWMNEGHVDKEANLKELEHRCVNCKGRMSHL